MIGPHAIHVQARLDPDKQRLPMTYKVYDADLETIMADWPPEWCEPINIQEVLTGPLADAPVDPLPDSSSDRDFDGALMWTPTHSDVEWKFELSRTKKKKIEVRPVAQHQ